MPPPPETPTQNPPNLMVAQIPTQVQNLNF
jgi:hypothetical protein